MCGSILHQCGSHVVWSTLPTKTSVPSDFALPCPCFWQMCFLLLKKGALRRSLALVKQRKQMPSVLSCSFDMSFPFSCSPPNPSISSRKMSYTNEHSTVLASLWTRRVEVFIRVGATNAFWRTKKRKMYACATSSRDVFLLVGKSNWVPICLEEWKGREWNGTKKERKSARFDDGEEQKI